jgi:AcrR family transcriptional regulator
MSTTTTPDRVPYSMAARELLRSTLLDAACHQLSRSAWADVTMADIALAAGVSRQTLYKQFGSREEFAQHLVVREADRLLLAVEEAVNARLDAPVAALAAGFDVFVRAVAENPLVHAIVRGGGAAELVVPISTQDKSLVESAAERLTDVILNGWPLVGRENAGDLSECLIRLAVSYASLPKGPSGMSAASVARLLGPYVEQLVATAAA